ncbi:MAG: RDD family protein [Armatimonadota bacterium]
MILVTDEYAVLTPEKVVVSFTVASLGTRILAHLIDLFCAAIFVFGLVLFFSLFLGSVVPELAQAINALISVFGLFGYFILFEALWQGQTFGKRMSGVRVVMTDGTPVTGLAAFYRNLLRPADMFPGFLYLVGFVSVFTNPRAQRLGDIVAGTMVIRTVKPVTHFAPAPHRYGIHPFEPQTPGLEKMTIEEYFAIKRLCDRFPLLLPTTQKSSIERIWAPFAAKHGIEPIKDVHPVYQMEAVVMKYSRLHKLV